MNTALAARGFTLRQLLVMDALTCVVTGLVLVLAAQPLTALLGLPTHLLFYAGVVLFPCAALMLVASRSLSAVLTRLVIWGNIAWAAASVVAAFAWNPTTIGFLFVLAQAAVVGALALMEWRALR